MDLQTFNRTTLAKVVPGHQSSSWSPEGNQIVFAANGRYSLLMQTVQTLHRSRRTHNAPSLHGHHRRNIAFVSDHEDNGEVYVINPMALT
jgi:Tol biopolymer transport system component